MKAIRKHGRVRRRRSTKQIADSAAPMRIETILVPIDFSRACLQALPWAKFLARVTKCAVHLVHVHGYEHAWPAGMKPPTAASPAEIEKRLRRHLTKFAKTHGLSGATDHCHIRTGNAPEQICKVAHEIGADFLVISSHGHTAWKQVFLGSNAERIVRHACCPVLVARRPRPGTVRAPSIRKIVVPLDFSPASCDGLEFAVRLAQLFGASLTLLHVVNEERYLTPEGAVMYAGPESAGRAKEAAKERMRARVSATDFHGVEFMTAVPSFRGGTVEDAICAYAGNRSMDLIVSTTHGRTGFRHALLGSVAEHIVRYAKGAVLVVPTGSGRRKKRRLIRKKR